MRIVIYTKLLVILLLNTLHSSIITVDNNHPHAGQYQTLQQAHDAASPGDSIYVFPSMVPYNAITVTKQLYFLGVGFNITENIGEPFTVAASISGTMIFYGASEYSWLEGFEGNFTVIISANNITIKRNDIYRLEINYEGSGSSIIQNLIILYGSYNNISINSATNILLSNNIIIDDYIGSQTLHMISGGQNLVITNNVFKSRQVNSITGTLNSEIVNNIFIVGQLGGTEGCSFRYNMSSFSSTYLSNGIGNLQDIDMSTVFVDYANYNFHLLSGSPAFDAGENGTDMGAYGGDAPYIDGGFPGLPSILQILAPTVGSQQSGLNIQFKVKSNNE